VRRPVQLVHGQTSSEAAVSPSRTYPATAGDYTSLLTYPPSHRCPDGVQQPL